MHIFLWFGWSVIWSIFCFFPLLRRLIGAMSGGTPARQRQGSIRLLLGALGAICASSGLSAMFGSDGVGSVDAGTGISAAAAGVYQSNTFGHALSDALTGIFGSWIATLVLLLLAAASLRWLFRLGRAGRSSTDDVSAAVLVTRDMPRGKPRDKPRDSSRFEGMPATPAMPSVSNTVGARISERKMQRDHVVATRRAAPWKLPSAPISGAATGSTAGAKPSTAPVQPQPSPKTTSHRAPWSIAPPPPAPAARNESQWAPFESLRPTPAMMARSRTLASRESAVERMPGSTRSTTSALASTLVSTSITATNPVSRPSARDGLLTARASQGPLPATLPAAFPRIAPSAAANSAPNAAPGNARPALDFEAPLQAEARPIAPLTTAAAATAAVIAPTSTNWPWRTDSPAAATTSPHGADIMQTAAPQSPPVSAPASATSIMPMPTTAPASPFYTRTFDAPTAPAPSIPTYDEPDIILPALALLDAGGDERIDIPAAQLEETGRLIEQRLKEFKVPVTVLGAYSGPVITRYEVEPALGVRGAQIVNLMKDLSRALGLTSIRVVETIPGKTCMGLELPNSKRQMIRLAEIFESDAYRQSDSKLTLAMGKDITGLPVVTDLARAPHMLVAGTTGSGKSVAINAMILSLLYKSTPKEVRLIMIDPKMLELSVYDGIPHLLAPVVTDMKLAGNALTWCVTEMDKRYRLMSALGVRNLAGYNQKIRDGIAAEKYVKNPFSLTPDAPEPLDTLPLIVVIIDELADLMMVTGKKIEELIARLAQKARAAGIHLILATQRPSVDVITGLIKANIPTRVAFQVSSKIDSRTVLDQMGAEALLGHGDMLFLPPGSGYPQRVHGAFVSDQEVHRVVQYLKSCGEPDYEEAILSGPAGEQADSDLLGDMPDPEADPLYDEAVAFVARTRRASISSVQRQFRVGYNRAARLVEQMEAAGILS